MLMFTTRANIISITAILVIRRAFINTSNRAIMVTTAISIADMVAIVIAMGIVAATTDIGSGDTR